MVVHLPYPCARRRVNPYGENYYDGISLNPFEVMFVKVKGVLLQNDWSYARVAKKYDEWMTMQVPSSALAHTTGNVRANLFSFGLSLRLSYQDLAGFLQRLY